MTFEGLPQGFKDWKNQYACDNPSSPGYNIRDLYAAYTAGVQDERGRCHKIAEETDIEPETCNEYGELTRKYDSWVNGVNDACSQIAAAIRGKG